MFNLFNLMLSDREKIKQQAQKSFDVYLPAIKGMDGEEIATVLDFAAQIKNTTTMYGKHELEMKLFRDPSSIPVHYAYETLFKWLKHTKSIAHTQEGQAKAGALAIWWLSVASFQIPELRLLGKELWMELARGFPYVNIFRPELDCVIGLIDYDSSVDPSSRNTISSNRAETTFDQIVTQPTDFEAWRARVIRTLAFVFDIDVTKYLHLPYKISTSIKTTVSEQFESELEDLFKAKKTSLLASLSLVDSLLNRNISPWIPFEIQRNEIGFANVIRIYEKCRQVVLFDQLDEAEIIFYMAGYDRGFLAHCSDQIDGYREEIKCADLDRTQSELLIEEIFEMHRYLLVRAEKVLTGYPYENQKNIDRCEGLNRALSRLNDKLNELKTVKNKQYERLVKEMLRYESSLDLDIQTKIRKQMNSSSYLDDLLKQPLLCLVLPDFIIET